MRAKWPTRPESPSLSSKEITSFTRAEAEVRRRVWDGTREPSWGVSRHIESKAEILRVEIAPTDGRIEAAICRQFGAEFLLILPVFDNRRLVWNRPDVPKS